MEKDVDAEKRIRRIWFTLTWDKRREYTNLLWRQCSWKKEKFETRTNFRHSLQFCKIIQHRILSITWGFAAENVQTIDLMRAQLAPILKKRIYKIHNFPWKIYILIAVELSVEYWKFLSCKFTFLCVSSRCLRIGINLIYVRGVSEGRNFASRG